MTTPEYPYEYKVRDNASYALLVETRSSNRRAIQIRVDDSYRSMYLPTDPAELHQLTEAIHGRKIAAIVYEDELPEVVEREEDSSDWIYEAGDHPLDREKRYFGASPDRLRAQAASILAIARHIEARDAAADRDIEALREELAKAGMNAPTSSAQRTAYARRAYELGARPGRTEAGA